MNNNILSPIRGHKHIIGGACTHDQDISKKTKFKSIDRLNYKPTEIEQLN